MSNDVTGVITLVGAFVMLTLLAGNIVSRLSAFFIYCFTLGEEAITPGVLQEIPREITGALVEIAGPLLLATAACAVIATFAQTKLLVSTELLKPKFSKLNPIQGFKNLFSLRSVIEALKGVLKISVLLIIIYQSIRDMFTESAKYLYAGVPQAAAHIFDVMTDMIWRVVLAFAVLAAADFFYQRWEYERNLKMTKEEVKEEYKQIEGNPQIKGKIREIQRSRARQRMMQQVPQADVVIRNPTHVAVALRYRPEEDPAPIVLAMGVDELALRIVQVAEQNGVAVVENVPLARALFAEAELNREIPASLYEAVAEVLVFLFRIDEKQKLVRQEKQS